MIKTVKAWVVVGKTSGNVLCKVPGEYAIYVGKAGAEEIFTLADEEIAPVLILDPSRIEELIGKLVGASEGNPPNITINTLQAAKLIRTELKAGR